MKWILAALSASACFAGPFEIGGMVGYGAYRNATLFAPGGTATAGFGNSYAAGGVIGEDFYSHLSGEIRYLYQNGAPFVSGSSGQGNVQGQSHALHYDLLLEPMRRERKIRPYGIVGGGVKYFRNTGLASAVQPLSQIVTLTARNQLSALFTAGIGVRYRLADHVYARADFVDYITQFPSKLLVLAPGASGRGIFHQFTPTVGITFRP